MDKLILGTAEFNPDGYAGKPCPDSREIVRILNLAWEGGIRLLDCAVSYNCLDLLNAFGCGFDRITKSRYDSFCHTDDFYHYKQDEVVKNYARRASVYTIEQLGVADNVIVPFNISNLAFKDIIFHNSPIIRSVFDRGRLLERGYTVKDCLSFVKRHMNDGIIVGVRTEKELAQILKVW